MDSKTASRACWGACGGTPSIVHRLEKVSGCGFIWKSCSWAAPPAYLPVVSGRHFIRRYQEKAVENETGISRYTGGATGTQFILKPRV